VLPNAEEIQKRRKSLGLTQKQLANLAGVSQSLIAKIESGRMDASYGNVKSIFEALDRESHKLKQTKLARDISTKRIVGASKKDKVKKAVELMGKNGLSQIPVFDGDIPVGSITERTIADYLVQKKNPEQLLALPVESVMGDAFPQVSEDTPVEAIASLLQYHHAVLTTKRGRCTGIITKADLFKIM